CDTEPRSHVTADTQVFGMQPHPETGGIGAPDHVRSSMHEVPARAGAFTQRVHYLVERQTLRARERHRFGHGLDDAGAHDLVRRLRGLATAGWTEVRDGLAERGQDGLRLGEALG